VLKRVIAWMRSPLRVSTSRSIRSAEAHNGLGLTEPLDPGTRPYYGRPYQVLDAGRFAAALPAAITDPLVGRLPAAGTADQVIDSTPALGNLRYPKAVTSVSGI